MAHIISFSNQKGGVGKTTTCVNLASCLASQNKHVLIVDFDAQGNATSAMGLFDKKIQNSIYDVVCNDLDIRHAIRHSEVNGLDFVPSCNDLAGAELELGTITSKREFVLKRHLDEVWADYDYIFVDCPPSLSLITVNALTASNGVIIPLQCEYFALEGLSQMMNTIRLVKKCLNRDLQVEGIVLTMYDCRNKLSSSVLEKITELFGDKVFSAKIPRNVRLAEAPSFGKPIILYDNKCSGALAFKALADEFLYKTKE